MEEHVTLSHSEATVTREGEAAMDIEGRGTSDRLNLLNLRRECSIRRVRRSRRLNRGGPVPVAKVTEVSEEVSTTAAVGVVEAAAALPATPRPPPLVGSLPTARRRISSHLQLVARHDRHFVPLGRPLPGHRASDTRAYADDKGDARG